MAEVVRVAEVVRGARGGARGRGGLLEVCGEDATVNWDALHGFRTPRLNSPCPSVWACGTWCKFHWELQQIFLLTL